jgi:hypothetical protein
LHKNAKKVTIEDENKNNLKKIRKREKDKTKGVRHD